MRYAISALAFVVLVTVESACGTNDVSSEGSEGFSVRAATSITTVPSLTKAKFIAHVNDLCRRKWPFIINAVKQTRNFTRKLHPNTSKRQRYLKGVNVSFFPAVDFHIFDEIRRLGAPPGENGAVEEVLGTMQEAVERGEQTGITSAGQLEALFAGYNRQAHVAGLDECLIERAHVPRPGNLAHGL